MWVRGLKLESFGLTKGKNRVAPYVGAWIETKVPSMTMQYQRSHPMWVRGLKPANTQLSGGASSRTLCGCVD